MFYLYQSPATTQDEKELMIRLVKSGADKILVFWRRGRGEEGTGEIGRQKAM